MELYKKNIKSKLRDIPLQIIPEILSNNIFKYSGFVESDKKNIFELQSLLGSQKLKFKYSNLDPLYSVNEEIERTRRVQKRIHKYIPEKIKIIVKEKYTFEKQSFRLSPNQYKNSLHKIETKLKKYKDQLKEYKIELMYRKRFVYKVFTSLIPSIYIIKREKYGVVQCKWIFLGQTQKQIHLGTWKKVGNYSEIKLKQKAIEIINKKYTGDFTSITLKWIENEKKILNKWCLEMNYRNQKPKIS